MKKAMNCSKAVAEAVRLCKPDVLAMYPITPSTKILAEICKMASSKKIDGELVLTESEFGAISVCAGSSATGVRSYTATASQGLALMHEVLFAAAGMRLPIVMNVANRSLSSPISIWNDHQDSISERDSGWLQLYAENSQEAVDNTIQAFKIAENKKVLMPVMSCLDGFVLTHVTEPVDIPESVDSFVGKYKPDHVFLDTENPMSLGYFSSPEIYLKAKEQQSAIIDASKDVVKETNNSFFKQYGRSYGNGLVQSYGDSDTVLVGMGSICGTLRKAADKLGCEVLKIRSYRPFPHEDVIKTLQDKKRVIVFDKNISLGYGTGALFSEVRSSLYKTDVKIVNSICGMGGHDVRVKTIEYLVNKLKDKKNGDVVWTK